MASKRRRPSFCLSAVLLLWVFCASVLKPTPPFYPDKMNLLVYHDRAGKVHPITTAAGWAIRREHILANMQRVMGALPDAAHKVKLDVQVTDEVKTARYVRRKLTFAVEKDDRVPAYLFLPLDGKKKHAAVLCLHQTTIIGKGEPAGLGHRSDMAYAVHLVERGYVTLAPDYPSFGEYSYDFQKSRWPSGSIKAVWNNMRAIDLLQTLPEVDPERIGCIGHSLGGHNAMFTAAFDTRIKATVANCGFTSFRKYYGGNLKGWTSARYMPRIASLYRLKPEKMPFDFSEVVATFAPRAFLASAPIHDDNFDVSGVKDCIAAAKPVYKLLGAEDKLAANYPDCKHDFPPPVRKVAYAWLDRWLKEKPASKSPERRGAKGRLLGCDAATGHFRSSQSRTAPGFARLFVMLVGANFFLDATALDQFFKASQGHSDGFPFMDTHPQRHWPSRAKSTPLPTAEEGRQGLDISSAGRRRSPGRLHFPFWAGLR